MSAADSEPEPAPRDNRSGTVLAQRYRLQRRLSVGGMGEVYEARHTEIPRRFAVKLLRPDFARDPQMRARFRSEAETAASLSSDHIIEVTDFGHAEDGSPYLVMELLDGVDLRRLLVKDKPLATEQAIAVALETCAGLAVAHAQEVVHRDLKPENLFVARRGERVTLKLLDFGIAKLRNQSLGTGGGGRLLGTPAYMPPEQVRGDRSIDHRADIYALGVILYEMLSGALAHPGANEHEIIAHILFEPPVPLRDLNPELPPELAAVVHKALERAPADRFQNVAELVQALAPFATRATLPVPLAQDVAGQPTLPARSSQPGSGSTDGISSLPPTERPAAESSDRARSLPQLLFAGAVLVLIMGSLAALQLAGRPAAPADKRAAAPARPNPPRAPAAPPELSAPLPAATTPAEPPSLVLAPAAIAPAAEDPVRPERAATSTAQRAARRAATGERPRTASRPAGPADPRGPTAAEPPAPSDGTVIEVPRDAAPLFFKRENPFRR